MVKKIVLNFNAHVENLFLIVFTEAGAILLLILCYKFLVFIIHGIGKNCSRSVYCLRQFKSTSKDGSPEIDGT